MKHIFTIHSPITFFSACAVIFQEKLPHEDVIIINDGYKVPFSVGRIVASYQQKDKGIWKKIKNFNLVSAYDSYLNRITNGQQYIAYIDLMHAYQRLLITNPKCIKFNFIEEGTASYVVPDNLLFITNGAHQVSFRNKNFKQSLISLLRVFRGFNIRVLSLPFNPQAFAFLNDIKFYTFSEHGFPKIEKEKKVVLNPFLMDTSLWSHLSYYNQEIDKLIWIEESFPKVYGVNQIHYERAIVEVVSHLKKKGKSKVFVKLRPNSSSSSSFLVKILINNNMEVDIIPDYVIAELLFIHTKHLQVIGIVSSLLFYAAIFGHESYSFFEIIEEKPSTPFEKMNFYWDVVKNLNLN
ncbi:polysialyltransferase family glycosyltransferase [Flavobacterium sp.]|uniref:polysialyltransferase family glycosyltransferase n=1 Tax=Flavobacterium sp. TaxID=239 RepID=UPI0040481F54